MNTENDCKPGFVIKLTIAPTETNTTLKSMCGGTCGGVAVNGGIQKTGLAIQLMLLRFLLRYDGFLKKHKL